mmetsp:Transcript_12456/g.57687  ORF Transcript_12456/g.57687 Transcript_12456/m.57687 type:complete len:261 (+) Transcript_12456:1929-2711(+)
MWDLASGLSMRRPMVAMSLHSASTSSSSGFFFSLSSFMMHVCMMRAVSISFLKSSPMKRMLPNMRRRESLMRSSRFLILRRSSRSSSSGVLGLAGTSPSSFSSTAFSSSFSASPDAFFSASSISSCSTALMSASPFSNSSWHLFSNTRLKLIIRGPPSASGSQSGSTNSMLSARNLLLRCWHIVAYSSANVGSVRALSNSWAMRPMSVRASSIPSARICSRSFSKFCGVSLLRIDLNARCFFSSPSILVLSIARNLFSVC